MCSVVKAKHNPAGGLRGLDVKYREGGAAPGRWISTCSERLILRVICPLDEPSSPSLVADESAGPQALLRWLGSIFSECGSLVGTPRLSTGFAGFEASILFSVLQPGARFQCIGLWASKSGLCTFFVLSKSGDAVFLAVLESYVVLERPILSCYCHRPLFLNSLFCFPLQG